MTTICIFACTIGSATLVLYTLLPTFYHKYWNPHTLRHLPQKKQLLLSFDDGPDPRYTGALLDLLQQYNVPATFFVVATKALQHPELIERMRTEGHTVALHSCNHQNLWYANYRHSSEDFALSLEIMHRHGWQVQYYRPPWGRCNLFTYAISRQHRLHMVFWDIDAKDWSAKTTVPSIINQLLKKTKNGGIICLHDSGGAEDAPLKTIDALMQCLPIWQQEQYEFVKLESVV